MNYKLEKRRKQQRSDAEKFKIAKKLSSTEAAFAHSLAEQHQRLEAQAALLSGADAITYGHISGLLDLLATLNTISDYVFYFHFTVVAKTASLSKALHSFYGDEAASITPTLLQEPEKQLRSTLEEWLFINCSNVLRRPDNQSHYYDALLRMIYQVAKPRRVWQVDIVPTTWYAAAWDDFAFEGRDRVFMLHLGVSD